MIRIDAMTPETTHLMDSIPSSFEVSEVLDVVESIRSGAVVAHPVGSYIKRYRADDRNPADYVASDDVAVFFAWHEDRLAGQMILTTRWNQFCTVEDIGVSDTHRRHGIGTRLLDAAVHWAKERSRPGLFLETQETNVPACRFYADYGFTLEGFDRSLYAASQYPDERSETALFWYLRF